MEVTARLLRISPDRFQTGFGCRSPFVLKNVYAAKMNCRIRAGQIDAPGNLKLLARFREQSQRLVCDSQLCVSRIKVGCNRDSLFKQMQCLAALLISVSFRRSFVELDCEFWIRIEECRPIDNLTPAGLIPVRVCRLKFNRNLRGT